MAASSQDIINNLNQIYSQELGREADKDGLAFYLGQAQSGKSLDQIRAEIGGSTEGRAYDVNAIQNIYSQELGRAADPDGLTHYSNELAKGVSPAEIRRQINLSNEGLAFDKNMVLQAFQQQLGRAPETDALNYYTNALQAGTLPQAELVAQINATPEGRAYDLQTLNKAYETLFKRAPDTEGKNFYLDAMLKDPSLTGDSLMDFLRKGTKGADQKVPTYEMVPGAGTKVNVTPGTGTSTTNIVPGSSSTSPRFDTSAANAVIPQTIGPGGGAIETQIRQGVLPQRVVVGGAPVNISGGYAAYPYGTEPLTDYFATPTAKLQSVVTGGAMPTGLVTAPTAPTAPASGGVSVSVPTSVSPTASAVTGSGTPAKAPLFSNLTNPNLSFSSITTPTTPFANIAAPTYNVPSVALDFYTNPYLGMYTPTPMTAPQGTGGVTVIPTDLTKTTPAVTTTPSVTGNA
jgi:hypothetical protein